MVRPDFEKCISEFLRDGRRSGRVSVRDGTAQDALGCITRLVPSNVEFTLGFIAVIAVIACTCLWRIGRHATARCSERLRHSRGVRLEDDDEAGAPSAKVGGTNELELPTADWEAQTPVRSYTRGVQHDDDDHDLTKRKRRRGESTTRSSEHPSRLGRVADHEGGGEHDSLTMIPAPADLD